MSRRESVRQVVSVRKKQRQPLECDEYSNSRKTEDTNAILITDDQELTSRTDKHVIINSKPAKEKFDQTISLNSQRKGKDLETMSKERNVNQHHGTQGTITVKDLSRPKDSLKPERAKRNQRDSSSDDSSHSGSEELSTLRPDSKADSEGSESIAVDCHTGPSEVIVKGKNVSKIRVKFPPRPPGDNFNQDKLIPISGSRFKRQPSSLSLSNGQQPQEHGDENEYHPLSQEGPMKPFAYHNSLPSSLPDIQKGPSFSIGSSNNSSGSSLKSQPVSALSLDLGLQYSAYEWDSKIKHDIINGIEYFERKNLEMKDMNGKILKELERITRLNHQMEDSLKLKDERNKMIMVENDELKIKLDRREKENEKQKNEAMSQWTSRVKAEEMYMESKRDSEREIKTLKEQLQSKDQEITRLVSSAALKEKRKQQSDGQQILNKSLKSNMEDHLELLHKIARLEEEIAKLKHDKDNFMDNGKKAKDEVDGMKGKLKDQSSEIDTQFKRFLSLKKSFNDLREENEKLKLQLHVRGGKKNMAATAININNNTWPKNISAEGKTDTTDGVSYFGLPTKIGKAQGQKKVPKPAFAHKRVPSEGGFTDNLPPVPHSMK